MAFACLASRDTSTIIDARNERLRSDSHRSPPDADGEEDAAAATAGGVTPAAAAAASADACNDAIARGCSERVPPNQFVLGGDRKRVGVADGEQSIGASDVPRG